MTPLQGGPGGDLFCVQDDFTAKLGMPCAREALVASVASAAVLRHLPARLEATSTVI